MSAEIIAFISSQSMKYYHMLLVLLLVSFFSCKDRGQEQYNYEAEKGKENLLAGRELCGRYEFEEGIRYLLLSVENFSKVDEFEMLAKTYNILSRSYHDFGDYSNGTRYALLAVKTYEDHPDEVDPGLLWYAYNNLGINYDDAGQSGAAIESHRKALLYGSNASDSAYSYNNLGNTYKKLNRIAIAAGYFSRALLLAQEDPGDVYHLATVYGNMLDSERLLKNYNRASALIDDAYRYAHDSGSPEKLIDFYRYVHLLKSATNEFQESNDNLYKYVTLKDSLLTADKARIVYNLQLNYETEKKEKLLVESKLISRKKDSWLKRANSFPVARPATGNFTGIA